MRFAGIDIAAETHVVALVDEHGALLVTPTPFGEDAAGYQTMRTLLGKPEDLLVAMEATGHYWQNLVAELLAEPVAQADQLPQPLGCHRRQAGDGGPLLGREAGDPDRVDRIGLGPRTEAAGLNGKTSKLTSDAQHATLEI